MSFESEQTCKHMCENGWFFLSRNFITRKIHQRIASILTATCFSRQYLHCFKYDFLRPVWITTQPWPTLWDIVALLCLRVISHSTKDHWSGCQTRPIAWASYQIRKLSGCASAGNTRKVFSATDVKGNRGLAIPACIMARASRTYRDACRDR